MITVGSIRWFGPTWGLDPKAEIPVPLGEHCLVCPSRIAAGDQGIRLPWSREHHHEDFGYYHIRCFLLAVLEEETADGVIERNPGIK